MLALEVHQVHLAVSVSIRVKSGSFEMFKNVHSKMFKNLLLNNHWPLFYQIWDTWFLIFF